MIKGWAKEFVEEGKKEGKRAIFQAETLDDFDKLIDKSMGVNSSFQGRANSSG